MATHVTGEDSVVLVTYRCDGACGATVERQPEVPVPVDPTTGRPDRNGLATATVPIEEELRGLGWSVTTHGDFCPSCTAWGKHLIAAVLRVQAVRWLGAPPTRTLAPR